MCEQRAALRMWTSAQVRVPVPTSALSTRADEWMNVGSFPISSGIRASPTIQIVRHPLESTRTGTLSDLAFEANHIEVLGFNERGRMDEDVFRHDQRFTSSERFGGTGGPRG